MHSIFSLHLTVYCTVYTALHHHSTRTYREEHKTVLDLKAPYPRKLSTSDNPEKVPGLSMAMGSVQMSGATISTQSRSTHKPDQAFLNYFKAAVNVRDGRDTSSGSKLWVGTMDYC